MLRVRAHATCCMLLLCRVRCHHAGPAVIALARHIAVDLPAVALFAAMGSTNIVAHTDQDHQRCDADTPAHELDEQSPIRGASYRILEFMEDGAEL